MSLKKNNNNNKKQNLCSATEYQHLNNIDTNQSQRNQHNFRPSTIWTLAISVTLPSLRQLSAPAKLILLPLFLVALLKLAYPEFPLVWHVAFKN